MPKTAIAWTDETLNLWTGCTKVSPGCDNCYMYRQYPRLLRLGASGYEADPDTLTFKMERLDKIAGWRKPRMVFINSMSDTFHSGVSDQTIAYLFDEMIGTPLHTFQVLTKRPNRVRRWWNWYTDGTLEWPEHIWLGTSVESRVFLSRVDALADIAPVTFLSCEPLLQDLGWSPHASDLVMRDKIEYSIESTLAAMTHFAEKVWVIVGGESGPDHREMDVDWVRRIRDACIGHDVPFFFKQYSAFRPGHRPELDGRRWEELPDTAWVRKNRPGQLQGETR